RKASPSCSSLSCWPSARPASWADARSARSDMLRLPIFAYSGPRDCALVALAALVLALLPIVFDDPFFILVMQSLGYLFIATLGLDILVGWTWQLSLGHAGLYAVGAYKTALVSTRLAQ